MAKIGCFLCAPDVLHAEQLLISYQAVLFQMRCYHIDFLLCHIVFEAEVFLLCHIGTGQTVCRHDEPVTDQTVAGEQLMRPGGVLQTPA